MRHRKLTQRLSVTTSHRRALVANLVKSLLQYERIRTTHLKAKVASTYADKMISLAKRKDLSAERQAVSFLTDKAIVKKLFREIGPRFQNRPGGYTRVIRLDRRPGDKAFMAILELVDRVLPAVKEETKPEKEKKKKAKLEEAKA